MNRTILAMGYGNGVNVINAFHHQKLFYFWLLLKILL